MSDFNSSEFTPTMHPWNQPLWMQLTSESERRNHALLFSGDTGLGKRALAFALAHFVLTNNHNQSKALFNAGSHPDLHVVMPEESIQEDLLGKFASRYTEIHTGKPKRAITIEQVRALSQALTTHPHIGENRVVLIVYAETMNRNAANALLKSLEEPPANTLFLMVSDEVSKLAKTVRSRCSLINCKAPEYTVAESWVKQQNCIPESEIATYLAMSDNHPLQAISLYEEDYLSALKTVFTDVNGLWTQRTEVTQAAKNWQEIGGLKSVEILQKLVTDLLRNALTEKPKSAFFPVQQPWVQSTSSKLSRQRLLSIVNELNYAKRMLATTVDELLVLETLSSKFRMLPA